MARVIGGIIAMFLNAWFAEILWNYLMPMLFRLQQLGYWQMLGLVLLAHILFPTSSSPLPSKSE